MTAQNNEMTEQEMMDEHRADSMVRLQAQAEIENIEFDRQAAEKKAKREQYNAEQRQRTVEERRSRGRHLAGLANAINAAGGHQSTYNIDEWELTCDGVDLGWQFEIKSEYTSSAWRSRPTGKMRLTIGDYGNKTSYPQRKDGTFAYDKAAALLINYADKKIAEAKRQAAMSTNKADAVALQAEFNLPDYSNVVSPSARTDEKTVVVSLKNLTTTTLVGTPDQVRHILKTLKELGFRLSGW